MPRSSLFLAASFLVLAACQPASETSDELVAEAPPTIVEEVVEEVIAESVEPGAVEIGDHDDEHADEHDEHEDADGDDHDEHDDDEHDDHDDHDDHAADEDDHDHAGGEAHVHGSSELAVSIDADSVSVSVDGALANFDLDETIRTLDDITPYIDGVVELVGGDCQRESGNVSIRPIGDHGNLTVDLIYSCASIDGLEAIDVIGFEAFSGFEEVDAVILTEAGQTASTLTASNTRLDLP